jgi:hypothetical protein
LILIGRLGAVESTGLKTRHYLEVTCKFN